MSHEEQIGSRTSRERQEPHRLRLPGFVKDEDIGLGDVVKRAASIVGIRPCRGCAERAGQLNNWMVFSK